MVKILRKQKARFRIYVNDLETKEARSITLTVAENQKMNVDQLKEIIIQCIEQRLGK